MLQFSNKPDKVFTEIVSDALDCAIDKLKHDDYEVLQDVLPNASRVFDRETALETLERLDCCHKKSAVYDINDFHFILIYDVLENYCEFFNDTEYMIIEGTKISKIDFDGLIDLYFHDEDFLVPKGRILDSSVVNSKGYTLETLGIILGYEPSLSDLTNRLIQEVDYTFPKDDDVPLFNSESTEYPDYSIIDEMDREEARRAVPISPKVQKIVDDISKGQPWKNLGCPE